jgi:hypothetical protein
MNRLRDALPAIDEQTTPETVALANQLHRDLTSDQ